MIWLLDYLPEIESDLSVFHRIDEMRTMPGPRFCTFAVRLPAYGGAMAAAQRREAEAVRERESAAMPTPARPAPQPIEPTPEAMAGQPHESAELFSFGGP